MKKVILGLMLLLLPIEVLANGYFDVSKDEVILYVGDTVNIEVSAINSAGKLNITNSDNKVVSTSKNEVFLDKNTETIKLIGKSVGSATVSVVASNNYANYDEKILVGEEKHINVIVKRKDDINQEIDDNPKTGINYLFVFIIVVLILMLSFFGYKSYKSGK